jgi:heme-degrading monooxygenase HmoA
LRRIEDDRAHFLTVSFWESIEAIKRFAGSNPEIARYYPEDEVFLLDFELTVEHYEVQSGPRRPPGL